MKKSGCSIQKISMFDMQKSVARVISALRSQRAARRPYPQTTGSSRRLWPKLE
jgi:hypothetical protein